MMPQKSIRKKPLCEINVVPYIDVMLVLLVIFMVTTPLLSQGVKVDLPQASAQAIPPKDQEPLIVSVDAQGNLFLNISANPSQAIDAASLQNQVANELKNSAQRPVFVKGDKNVNYGKVMDAMVLLQQAGAPSVGLITQPPDKS